MMPDYIVTNPENGKKYKVSGAPDGPSALRAIQAQHSTPEGLSTSGKISSGEGVGAFGSIMAGVEDPIVGGKQRFGALSDEDVAQRETRLKQGGVNPLLRGVGNMAVETPLMAGGAMLGGPVGAAAAGALGGSLQPTVPGSTSATQNALLGAAGSLPGMAALKGAGKALTPSITPEARELMRRGFRLTPGQMQGGYLRRLENTAESQPILGTAIKEARGRGIEDLNIAYLNGALGNIGGKLPADMPPGRDALKEAYKQFTMAYSMVLPSLKFDGISPKLQADLLKLSHESTELPPSEQEQLGNILNNRLLPFLKPTAGAKRPELKDVDAGLREIAAKYPGNLGDYIHQFRTALFDELSRQNPKAAPYLKKIDTGYAMFRTAFDAAERRATSGQVFTANDLLQTMKKKDKSPLGFGMGRSLGQGVAETAQKVLPAVVPDSGTAEREKLGFLKTLYGLGLRGTVGLPYTEKGTAIREAIRPAREAVGNALQRGAPLAGAELSPLLERLGQPQ